MNRGVRTMEVQQNIWRRVSPFLLWTAIWTIPLGLYVAPPAWAGDDAPPDGRVTGAGAEPAAGAERMPAADARHMPAAGHGRPAGTVRHAVSAIHAKKHAGKVLYLTFDDGPSLHYTPRILDILKREHIRATFFVLGQRSTWFPGIVRRERLEGHEIGNHGFVHHIIVGKPAADVIADVRRADAAIWRASGISPVYYRPPGGMLTPEERCILNRLGHPIALWSVDSEDWRPTTTTADIIRAVERDARPGAVILFHDGVSNSKRTAEALPVLIRYFRARGYRFDVLPLLHVSVIHSLPQPVDGNGHRMING